VRKERKTRFSTHLQIEGAHADTNGVDAAQNPSWRIGDILLTAGLLTQEQLEAALEDQEKTGRRLGEIVVERGFVSGPALANALAEQHGGVLKTEYGMATGFGGRIRALQPVPQQDSPETDGQPLPQLNEPELPQQAPEPIPDLQVAPEPVPEPQIEAVPDPGPEPGPAPEPMPQFAQPTPPPTPAPQFAPPTPPPTPSPQFTPPTPPPDTPQFEAPPPPEPEPEPAPEPLVAPELEPEPQFQAPPPPEPEPEPEPQFQAPPPPEPEPGPVHEPESEPEQEPELEPAAAAPDELDELKTRLDSHEALLEELHVKVAAQETELESLRSALEARQQETAHFDLVPEQEPGAPAETSENHLLSVPTPNGFVLIERTGPAPTVGDEIEVEDQPGMFVVAKVAAQPLTGRVCAYLQRS
jgi:hypothetical protein